MKTINEFLGFVRQDLWVCEQLQRAFVFYNQPSIFGKKHSQFNHYRCTTRILNKNTMSKKMEMEYGIKSKDAKLMIVIDKQIREVRKVDSNTLCFNGIGNLKLNRHIIY